MDSFSFLDGIESNLAYTFAKKCRSDWVLFVKMMLNTLISGIQAYCRLLIAYGARSATVYRILLSLLHNALLTTQSMI